MDALLDDLASGEKITDVFVARVTKRMGSGRMQVTRDKGGDMIVPMRGGLRGKGKKTVWVDTGSIVMVAETGLGGVTHEIVAVFSDAQVARYKKIVPDTDPQFFVKSEVAAPAEGFEFDTEAEAEVDIDAL